MRDFLKSYFYWFLILIFIFCTNHSTQADDQNDCQPQLADTCFNMFSTSLNCNGTVLCDDPKKFCKLLDDSLQCSADIIDTDCSKTDGVAKFDSWYKGFRNVYSYICHPASSNKTQTSLVSLLDFRSSNCWNKKKFVKCVGEMLSIHHVVDMLKISYDYKECFRMIIAMTSCNVNSQSPSCDSSHEALINDLIFLFFKEQKCKIFESNTNNAGFLMLSNRLQIIFLSIVSTTVLNYYHY